MRKGRRMVVGPPELVDIFRRMYERNQNSHEYYNDNSKFCIMFNDYLR